ncbi:ankyrin repeat-containing domain protein [Aspergillus crustosus]
MVFLYSKRHEINNSTSPLPMGFKLSWPCRWAHQHGYIHCLSLYGSVLHITAKSPTVKQYMSTSSVEIARLLLQWGVNLEANNEYSEKPLHHAARWCDSGLIKFLLDCGATVDCVDQAGWTPLFEAICQNDNDSIIFLLLQHGADINKKLKDGRTLLHFCTDEEKDDQMQRVIELGQTSISRIVMDEHHSILQLARDPGL